MKSLPTPHSSGRLNGWNGFSCLSRIWPSTHSSHLAFRPRYVGKSIIPCHQAKSIVVGPCINGSIHPFPILAGEELRHNYHLVKCRFIKSLMKKLDLPIATPRRLTTRNAGERYSLSFAITFLLRRWIPRASTSRRWQNKE